MCLERRQGARGLAGAGLNGARRWRGRLERCGRGVSGGGRRRGEWAAPGGVGGDSDVDGDGEAAQQPGGVVRSEAMGGTDAKCWYIYTMDL